MAGFTIAIATAIAAGASTGAAVHSRRAQTRAGRQAAKYTEAAASQATRTENDAEARRREEYDREQAEARRQWDIQQEQLLEDRRIAEEERTRTHEREAEDRRLEAEDRRLRDDDRRIAEEERQRNLAIWNEREARLAPYRQAGAGALSEMARLTGQSGTPGGGTTGPRPMPVGWTPDSAQSAAPAQSTSDLPTTTSRQSVASYAETLPITRDPLLSRELGDEADPMQREPVSGPLSSMRQPTEDIGYILENPSAVSPEAYRRLVSSQGEMDPDALPLSAMRQPGLWARRPRRPVSREARA